MADAANLHLGDAPPELSGPVVEFFPAEEWDNAVRISYLESGWHWDAENDTTGPGVPCGTVIGGRDEEQIMAEHSIGYFQINACNFPQWNPGHFFNARQNAGTAHMLWEQEGRSWRPWHFSAKLLGLI